MKYEFTKEQLNEFMKGKKFKADENFSIDGCDNKWYDRVVSDNAGHFYMIPMLNGAPHEIRPWPKNMEDKYLVTEVIEKQRVITETYYEEK